MSSSENPGDGQLVPKPAYPSDFASMPTSLKKQNPEEPSPEEPSPEKSSPKGKDPEQPTPPSSYGKLTIPLSKWCESQFLGPDRGYGVIAIQDIPQGTIVLEDEAIIGIDEKSTISRPAQAAIKKQYEALSDEKRKGFDSLHCFISDAERAQVTKLAWDIMDDARIRNNYLRDYERARTFSTNCFDVASSYTQAALFLQASRFNHSCLPSCDYDVRLPYNGGGVQKARWMAYALRDIPKGEEVTIAYNYTSELRESRQRQLLDTWGFTCTCEVCDLSEANKGRADEHDAHLRDLASDAEWWGRNIYVKRKWDISEVAARLERLNQRIELTRAVQYDSLLWNTLTRAAKYAAALWLRTRDDAYLDRWKAYLNEARYGPCHRAIDPDKNATWDAEVVEDLEKGVPDPDDIYTDTEGGSDDDDGGEEENDTAYDYEVA
ncbi:hypothetical protein PG984_013091 [Apiospora sp. TS-2023a]